MDDDDEPTLSGQLADEGAAVNEWVNVLRRARLGPTVTAVALMIATYADPDGTRVYPGIARLAVQCELDYRTVRRAVAALRAAGLIEMVRRGARRSGRSDEYRLILAGDLLERCDVPAPAAEQLAIEQVTATARHRAVAAPPAASPVDIRSTGHPRPVEPVDNPTDHRSPLPCRTDSTGQRMHVLQDTGAPPPSMRPLPVDDPPSDDRARRTTRTGSEPHASQDTTAVAGQRRHGAMTGTSPDGQPARPPRTELVTRCPSCEAAPGESCRRPDGTPAPESHRRRLRAARQLADAAP